MKKSLLLFIFSLIISICLADPEPPVIRSFIKITLKDGTIKHGVITIAKPIVARNMYTYTSNGIYYKIGNFEGIMKFNMDLEKIELNKIKSGPSRALYKYSRWIVIPDVDEPTFQYVDCFWIDPIQENYEHLNNEDILIFHENLNQQYKFYNYLPIQEIVTFYYDTASITKIPLKDIIEIKLIANPSDILLKQLNDHKEQLNKKFNKSVDGFYMPLWYHELIKNNEKYLEYLLKTKF